MVNHAKLYGFAVPQADDNVHDLNTYPTLEAAEKDARTRMLDGEMRRVVIYEMTEVKHLAVEVIENG